MRQFQIKELALARGMTQETLAIKSGVPIRTIQRLWQNKVQRITLYIMINVADALGVDVRELYAPEDTRHAAPAVAQRAL